MLVTELMSLLDWCRWLHWALRRDVAADSGCLCGLDGRAEVSEGRLHLATTLWRVLTVGLGASL